MYCRYCGAQLREGAKFCTSCGKPVKTMNAASTGGTGSAAKADETRTAIKGEIKEKAIDFAKAGAKQIIAALKDKDITAPAQAGEIRCKVDQAQNAFMKLLKKGMLCLALLVISSSAGHAEVSHQIHQKLDNGTADYSLTINGETFKFEGPFDASDKKYVRTYYKAYGVKLKPGDKITFTAHYKRNDECTYGSSLKISSRSGYIRSNIPKGYLYTDDINSQKRRDEQTIEVEYVIPQEAADVTEWNITGEIGNYDKGLHFVAGYVITTQKAPVTSTSSSTATSATTETIDTAADSDSGENGWVVPAVVIGGMVAGGIALKRKKNKKSGSKDNKQPEKKENKKEDEDDEEKATYEMRIRKDFGDTLTPGEAPEKVYARIVRISADGKEATDQSLTQKISITGDDYLRVSMHGLAGDSVCASVEAPKDGEIPSEAVVNFRLAGAGGSFTNRMHFKIAKAGIIFFQENITLPACSDEQWKLPFIVQGASDNDVVEACSSCLEAYNVKIEPAEKAGCWYAVITEKAKDRKEPGTWELFNLGIRVKSDTSEMADSIPLYRFHMGLRFSPNSTVNCYLETDKTGKKSVPVAHGELVYFDWDPQTNDIVTVFPVIKDYKVTAEGETEQGYLEKLGIKCTGSSVTTDNGRQLNIYPEKGILDAPTRFKATITLTADCGEGRTETVSKDVLIASQPVRQNVTFTDLEEDKRIGEGLLNIQKSIWNYGEYNRLFPLYKLIDVMINGYDGAYGYDKHQVETVKSVYKRFLSGDLAGANATAQRVTLADEMALFVDSFLQTSEEVENSMGFFTRMAVGVVTLGMSDVVFTGLQVAREMKVSAERGGDTWDVFVAGVKVVAWDYAMEQATTYGLGKLNKAAQKYAPKQYEAVTKGAENLKKKASDYFSGLTGKKTGKVLENSKGVKSKAARQADDAIDAFKKNPKMSELDEQLDKVYKNGKAHGKAKVDDLQAAQWLAENNPTPENINLYKKKVLEVQRDKFAMQQLNNLPDGSATRAKFNKELDNVYKDVDDEVREILRKKGYDMDDNPFAATSSNKADLASGKKVTYDRDVTYKTKNGMEVPQKEAQEAYEKAFYKRTTGVDAPSDKAAREWAQMHDQSVVQKGSKVSYGEDLDPVIKDWDKKLADAERTGDVMTYKSTEWFEQTDQMIRKANDLPDSGMRLDMLEQALSKRQEATRQMVKQFKYVHARDVAAQANGAASKITEKMRFGMEISSKLFSTGEDALTLGQVESILAQNNLTLELLSLQLGETLKKIG